MTELMEVIEGAAYLSFVLLAVFAIFQLRIMARDRKTEFMMRVSEFVCSKDFQEPLCRLWRTDAQDAEGLEKDVSYTGLSMIADYFEGLSSFVERDLIEEGLVADQYNYPVLWEKIKPWVLPMRDEYPQIYSGMEDLARKSASMSP